LLSQGIIKDKERIKEIHFNPEKNFVQVKLDIPEKELKKLSLLKNMYLSSCGICSFIMPAPLSSLGKINSSLKVKRKVLFGAMEEFEEKSHLFKTTGGNHSCALYNGEKLEVFAEDIGRHNAVDKVIGKCFLQGIETKGKTLLLSGRISWEILTKAAIAAIPLVASPSAPTSLAIHLAKKLNVTVVGFLRKERMNVYTHTWRVI